MVAYIEVLTKIDLQTQLAMAVQFDCDVLQWGYGRERLFLIENFVIAPDAHGDIPQVAFQNGSDSSKPLSTKKTATPSMPWVWMDSCHNVSCGSMRIAA